MLPVIFDPQAFERAVDQVYEAIERRGPYDGILGFSLGAGFACSFLHYHAQLHPHDWPQYPFRFAVFFSGVLPPRAPGLSPLLENGLLPLLDDGSPVVDAGCRGVIQLPSLHVCSKQDDAYVGSIKLFEMCKRDVATLICHSKGHEIPKDPPTTRIIANAIRESAARSFDV